MASLLAYARLAPWVGILLLIAHDVRMNELRERWHHMYQSEHSGRLGDRASYAQAQRDAAAANKAEVARIEQQSQRITDETQTAYQRDLAELRRLRGESAAAKGSAGSAGAAKDGATAGGSHADGLPVPPSDDVQAASEIELRLMHLQNWVEQQIKN